MNWRDMPTVSDAIMCQIRQGASEESAKGAISAELNWISETSSTVGHPCIPRNGIHWTTVDFFEDGDIEIGKFGLGDVKVLTKPSGVAQRKLTVDEVKRFRDLLWSAFTYGCQPSASQTKYHDKIKIAGEYIKSLEITPGEKTVPKFDLGGELIIPDTIEYAKADVEATEKLFASGGYTVSSATPWADPTHDVKADLEKMKKAYGPSKESPIDMSDPKIIEAIQKVLKPDNTKLSDQTQKLYEEMLAKDSTVQYMKKLYKDLFLSDDEYVSGDLHDKLKTAGTGTPGWKWVDGTPVSTNDYDDIDPEDDEI